MYTHSSRFEFTLILQNNTLFFRIFVS